jgi:hypothetical protein
MFRGMDSWKMLEQLEKAVTSVWESGKAPLRVRDLKRLLCPILLSL